MLPQLCQRLEPPTTMAASCVAAVSRPSHVCSPHCASREAPGACQTLSSAPFPQQQQQQRKRAPLRPLRPRRCRAVAAAAAEAGSPQQQQQQQQAISARPGNEFFSSGDARPVILFDGVCNLCNGGVQFMLDWDRRGVFRMAALQSEAGRALLRRSGRDPDDISSIVLVEREASYIKSEAILRIGSGLGAPLPLVAGALNAGFPLSFKNGVYDLIAANRYNLFGRTPSCRLSDPSFEDRFIS